MPEAQPEHRHAGSARARITARPGRTPRRRRIASGNAPTPGTTRPSAAGSASWSAVSSPRAPDPLERLLDRAPVAHPVVDDADRGHGLAHPVSVPFVDGHARLGRVERDRRAQRAGERLEAAPRSCGGRSCPPRRAGAASAARCSATARKNSSVSSWSKPPVAPGGRAPSKTTERPAGDVDRARSRAPRPSGRPRGRSGRCRRGRRAPRRAPGRARCRCPRRCGARRSRRSPVDGDVEVEAAVAGEQVEHVVEEADAGRARARARGRRARARAATSVSFVAAVRSRRCGVIGRRHSPGPPSTRVHARSPRPGRSALRGPPARAAAAAPMCTSLMRRRKCRGRQRRRRSAPRRRWAASGSSPRRSRRTPSRSPRRRRRSPALRTRGASASAASPTSSRCSGAKASANASAASASGASTSTRAASPSPPRSSSVRPPSSSAASSLTATTIVPSPCSAWASEVGGDELAASAPVVASTSTSLGP